MRPGSLSIGGKAVVRPALVAAVAAAVLVAGCTSSKKTPAAGSPSASASAVTSPSATASGKGDAQALVAAAKDALAKAKSVHVKGTITQGSETITLDMTYANGVGATGSIGFGGGTFKMTEVDKTLYIQGDAKAFSSFTGGDASGAAAQLAGKWIKVGSTASSSAPAVGALGDFSSLADLSQFADQFAPDGAVSILPDKKTINGKSATGILDSGAGPSDAAILYVESEGSHRPLQVVPAPSVASAASSAAPTSGEIDFIDYDANVTITAPSGALDISQLASLFGGASTSG